MQGSRHLCIGRRRETGIALITVLLLSVIISVLAIAVIYKLNSEQKMQKENAGQNLAYYGAEAALENMTVSLNNLYFSKISPNWCDIQTDKRSKILARFSTPCSGHQRILLNPQEHQ